MKILRKLKNIKLKYKYPILLAGFGGVIFMNHYLNNKIIYKCTDFRIDIDPNIIKKHLNYDLSESYSQNIYENILIKLEKHRDALKKEFENFNDLCIKIRKDIEDERNKNIIVDDIHIKNEKIINDRKKELDKYSKSSELYIKRDQWINYYYQLPTKFKLINLDSSNIKTIMKNLNNQIYGLFDVKNEIISIIYSQLILKNNTNSSNITFVGPPGVGKTSTVQKIAAELDIPLIIIPMGNITDNKELTGISYHYHGSEPGLIVKKISQCGFKNGIILFDEIDKITSPKIWNVLLHILDPTQNKNYSDTYLDGISIDLSNYLFVFTMNDNKNIPEPLYDRIGANVIVFDDYTSVERFNIVKNILMPNIQKEFNNNDLILDDNCIKFIIELDEIKKTTGLRKIHGTIRKIFRKKIYNNLLSNINDKYINIDFVKTIISN